MGLNNILLRIKTKGYIPVLAHPERYVYMDENDYRQLKGLNVRLQLNLFFVSRRIWYWDKEESRMVAEKQFL